MTAAKRDNLLLGSIFYCYIFVFVIEFNYSVYLVNANSGYYTIVRDNNSTIDNTLQKLIEHFKLNRKSR